MKFEELLLHFSFSDIFDVLKFLFLFVTFASLFKFNIALSGPFKIYLNKYFIAFIVQHISTFI